MKTLTLLAKFFLHLPAMILTSTLNGRIFHGAWWAFHLKLFWAICMGYLDG